MSAVDAHDFPAGVAPWVLAIPVSVCRDWRADRVASSRRELDDVALLEQVLEARGVSELAAAYGSPRFRLEWRRRGVRACTGMG